MLNATLVCVVSLDLDKWINEPPSDSDGDQVDDAGFFLAPPSTSGADFYQTRGHASPASSRSSKRDEQEDDEDVKRVSLYSVALQFQCIVADNFLVGA